MSWTDVQTWVALFVTAAATWVAVLARNDSKRSADAAAEALELQRASAQAAADALELQRSEAHVAREALELQRAAAEVAREALELQQGELERIRDEMEPPKPSFTLRNLTGYTYLLRNDGPGTAVNVKVTALGNALLGGEEEPLVLRPGEGKALKLGNWLRGRPTVLHVIWDGQEHDVLVHVPPAGHES